MLRAVPRLAAALAVCLASLAAGAEPGRSAMVDALLDRSGAERQLAPVADQLAEQLLSAQGDELVPGSLVLLAESARREFAAAKLLPEIRATLANELDEPKARAVLAWLATDTGRRVTALEEAASQTGGQAELEAYAKALEANPPRPERVAAVQRIGAAIDMLRFTTDVALAMARTTALAFNAASKTPRPEGDVRDAVERQRAQVEPALAAVTLVSMLKTYHDATDEELARYAGFLESEEGRWYTRVVERALLSAYENAAGRMAASAAAALREPPETQRL